MTTRTLTADLPWSGRLQTAGQAALFGAVASLQISIAAAQALVAIAALCWLARHVIDDAPLEAPAFFWPLVGYAAATLVSALCSRDPATSITDSKQLFLFLLVPVTFDFARGRTARTVLTVMLTAGAVSALIGVVQYGILNYDNLGRRPQGTLSHWMTYSGTLMLVICIAAARLMHDTRDRIWAAVVMPALVVSLVLTFTRSAWVGASAGIGVLFLLRDFRLVGLLPIAVAVMVALAPAQLTDRVYSMFDLNDPTNRDRVAMLQSGVAMVADHPLTGVGPDMVAHVYPAYRVASAVQASNPHLHNVPMQIAAERGLPALALWTWTMGALSYGLWRLLRRGRQRALAATALAGLVAMLTAGLFEYNFGDSEFLMLLLVLVTLPFAADRDGGLP